jgi:SAM-dependent methyltransferase
LSHVPAGGRILEIGCGTGHATLPLARRGYRILAVELGENLAAVTRQKLQPWPQAQVVVGDFEKLPIEAEAFDLAISASAFHWIDPAIGFPKVAQSLRPGGAFAPWGSHRRESQSSEGFSAELRKVHEREAPGMSPGERRQRNRDRAAGLKESGLFHNLRTREYRWQATYDAAGYLALLSTYSGYAVLEPSTRERLFRAIADLVNTRYGGRVVLDFLTTLHIAEKA